MHQYIFLIKLITKLTSPTQTTLGDTLILEVGEEEEEEEEEEHLNQVVKFATRLGTQ